MSDPFDLPALFRFELTEDEHVRLARLCSRDRMVKEMLALGAATAATSAAYREGRAASMFVAVFGVLAFLAARFPRRAARNRPKCAGSTVSFTSQGVSQDCEHAGAVYKSFTAVDDTKYGLVARLHNGGALLYPPRVFASAAHYSDVREHLLRFAPSRTSEQT